MERSLNQTDETDRKLKILILEDNPVHAELLEDDLRTAGFAFSAKRVETANAFREALVRYAPDLILSDYDLPGFNGMRALQMAKDLCPGIPFILVTGAIGEEKAIDILTSGATDYVLKNRMSRFVPAVQRAMKEVKERKEREKAEWSFKVLVEQIPAVTYRIRPSDRSMKYSYLYVSPQSESALGIPPSELLANPDLLINRIHRADRASVIDEMSRSLLEERTFSAEYRVLHPDGRTVWVHDEAALLRDESGVALYYQGILRDITPRKQAEEALRRAHDTLEQRVKERTEELEAFTSSVSHDLRGPLWMLDNYIQMLTDDYSGRMEPDLEGRIETIQKTVNQMDRLIEDLLSLSRVDKAELAIAPIDFREIVFDAWREICDLNPSEKICLTVKDLPAAQGDRNLIRQAIYNLLSNAAKFSGCGQHPVIEVGGHAEGNHSVVYIRDNGVGFDMKDYDKLFTLFQRLHGSAFEGTGVGLAIVHRIVRRHGGTIKAEAKVNEGATFTISIPTVQPTR